MMVYRACYWVRDDGTERFVLTSPGQSGETDETLRGVAQIGVECGGIDLSGGKLVIGPWRDELEESDELVTRTGRGYLLCATHRAEVAALHPDRELPPPEWEPGICSMCVSRKK